MKKSAGIHHITAFAADPQETAQFYHQVLGQRLVKRTVNFDDPETYHLYFADATGTPGTVLTFFPIPRAARGRSGAGAVTAVSYAVPPTSLTFWQQRLEAHGVAVHREPQRLRFEDPHGLALELVSSAPAVATVPWPGGPVPEEHRLRGFLGATLGVSRPEPTAAVLSELLGYRALGVVHGRHRFGLEGPAFLDLEVMEGPARMGAGVVHHIAFRAQDDAHQGEIRDALRGLGVAVTPVRDRNYFHSIYFREPQGTLFEVATDTPGFLVDEPAERLGQELRLPAWLEPRRRMLEEVLPGLDPVGEIKRPHQAARPQQS